MKNILTIVAVVFAAAMLYLLASGGFAAPHAQVASPQTAGAPTSASPVIKVNAANYAAEVENSTIPVAVEFSATWCGPCQSFRPKLDKAAEEFQGKVKFVTIDTDESPELANKWGIRGIPTVVFVHPGHTTPSASTNRLIGNHPLESLEQFVKDELSK